MTSRQIRLSHQAAQRLESIRSHSLKQFGAAQTKHYLENLQTTLRLLAENPRRGVDRSDIKHGYYAHAYVSHMIYYSISEEAIGVIDILHQSMDPSIHIG